MYGVNEVMNCFMLIKTWVRRLYESKHARHVQCGARYKTINITWASKVHCPLFTLSKSNYYSLSHIVYLTMSCRQSCVKRQFIMSKRKFHTEMGTALAPVLPYLTPEKPKKKRKPTGTSFLPHLVPEEHLMKTNKLPPPPVVGKLPYIDMKLSWNGSPEFCVRAMWHYGANVQIISQSFVDMHKVPGVLHNHRCDLTMCDGSESNTNAGRA